MNKRPDFTETQWLWTKRFAFFAFVWILLILAINTFQDAQAGRPFNSENLLYTLGLLAFGAILLLLTRLILKFVRNIYQVGRDR